MNLPAHVDVDSIGEVYLLSNTPTYLYDRLRANASVQWIANHMSVDEIIALYRGLQGKPTKSACEAALAYAFLVSLSIHVSTDATRAIQFVPLEGLEWGEQVKALCTNSIVSTNITSITIPRIILPGFQTIADSSTVTPGPPAQQ
jgi:hypothetical protein